MRLLALLLLLPLALPAQTSEDAPQAYPYTITANTRAYYRFSNNRLDSSGLGRDGTSDSNVVYTADAGRFTLGGKFNGVGSFVKIPDSVKGWNSQTVMAWVRFDSVYVSGVIEFIISSGPALSWNMARGGSGMFRINNRTSSLAATGWTTNKFFAVGQWTHVAYVHDADAGIFMAYYNGDTAVVASRAGNQYQESTGRQCIGRQQNATGIGQGYLRGAIDEVIVENRAWSWQEIQTYYNAARTQRFPN